MFLATKAVVPETAVCRLADFNFLTNFCFKMGKTSDSEESKESKKPRLYKCSVPQCKSKVEKYFSYPSNEKQRALWLEAFGLTECKPRAIICKCHFLESDIVTRNLKFGAGHSFRSICEYVCRYC